MIVDLTASQAWSAEVRHEGIEVRVIAGEVWITRERDVEDHLLAAPQTFRSGRRGRLAVQALGAARLEVVPLPRPRTLARKHAVPVTTE